MRISTTLVAALLAGSSVAAPAPIPDLVSSILGVLTNDLNRLLSSLGIKVRQDGQSHGTPVNYHKQCPFSIQAVVESTERYLHKISWPQGVSGNAYMNWKTFKANGANLGGWLEKERTHDPIWWEQIGGGDAPDEWTLCQNLGSKCGPIFEERYASFLNTSTIDQLASVGVNTLRIPTTYAAWISIPGSQLYHGNQQSYLKTVTNYAITKYNMHSKFEMG